MRTTRSRSRTGLVEVDSWQLLDGLAERLLPPGLDRQQIRILGVEPPPVGDPHFVAGIDQKVERRADRHVRAHRRVE